MDRDQVKALQARYSRRSLPIELTPEELDLANDPVQTDIYGVPVKAWIRFQDCAELVKGEAHSWTSKAVHVTWYDGPVIYRTWVWASAVTRETPKKTTLGERTRKP
ncbi:hypothetical protein [Pseudarthrobacter sp. PS3-L1]|uniref:hypothetical protein n=1 Tax=Pseudarthrobacter sp. PS3-L1 TaxID=3046207 RepID=UPI0024BAF614|nr:hypothetical protein [Pseudarthrobacter sp. PS3-L1]MDJ0322104.1 hypothetical protein [Pseudarthrobacter sp. PS3-L1]